MEQSNSVKRPRRRKKASGVAGLVARLKQSPVAYNAVLIALVVVAIIVASSILMMIITRHGTHRTVPDYITVSTNLQVVFCTILPKPVTLFKSHSPKQKGHPFGCPFCFGGTGQI